MKIMVFSISSYLFQVQPKDRKIIQFLSEAFQNNKRMRILLGRKGNSFSHKIQIIISFCYFMVKKWGGIFYSKNQSTFLLFYRNSEHYFSLKNRIHYLYLAFFVIGIHRLPSIIRREKWIRKTRQLQLSKTSDNDFIYVWFLGQRKDYKKIDGLLEAKNYILQQARILQLPIYMETTDERLLIMYRRAGFKFYDCLKDEETGMKIWFGRYAPPINLHLEKQPKRSFETHF